jgi:hypothetical protein
MSVPNLCLKKVLIDYKSLAQWRRLDSAGHFLGRSKLERCRLEALP